VLGASLLILAATTTSSSLLSAAPAPVGPGDQSTRGQEGLGEYVVFPSCAVKVRQPEGFETAEAFDGFRDLDTQSSVMVVRIEAPFAETTKGFAQEHMRPRGWTLHSRQEVEVGSRPALLIHFEQPAGGRQFLKWVIAFGDEKSTTLVTAAFPKDREQELSARLKATVLSTQPEDDAPAEPGADVPFTITPSPELKPTRAMSRALAYTKDGSLPTKSPEDPLFIAAPSFGSVAKEKRRFAEQRLLNTAQTKDLVIKSTEKVTVDGLEGFESVAEAVHASSGTPLVIHQVILFDEGSYILMQGLVGADLSDQYLPEFKTMARSLRRKQS
jgi:hypothetical protein